MKLHVLLFVLLGILADVHAVDYRGIVYIKKTGIGQGPSVVLDTNLIFESEFGVGKKSLDTLKKNFTFTGSKLGRRLVNEEFVVIGDLILVRLTVRLASSQQTVCDKEIPEEAISPGNNLFKCLTNTGSDGTDTEWLVNLRIVKRS